MRPLFFASGISVLLLSATPALAATHTFVANMDGAQDSVATPGTGSASVVLDDVTGNVTVNGSFTGLTTPAIAAHIHGLAGPGVSAGILITLTVPNATSGSVTGSGTLVAPNIAGMINGQTYINIHSTNFPGGEIRGQDLATTPAPALPAWCWISLGIGLAMASWLLGPRRERAVN